MGLEVNRKLLPLKLFYFNYLAGIAVLFPFLPIFYKSVGLSQTETAIIFGTMPFVGFVSRLLLGALADKYRKHKQLLIACVIAHTLAFDAMVFIPFTRFRRETSETNVSCSMDECRNSSSEVCSLSCEDEPIACRAMNESSLSCNDNATCVLTCESRVLQLDNFSVFCTLLVLNLVGNMFFNAITSLQDTITVGVLGEKGHAYGRQRLWGTIGFGLFAVACGFLLDATEFETEMKFLPAFVLHFVLNVLAVLCTIPFRTKSDIHCSNMMSNMFRVLKMPDVAICLFLVLAFGINYGVIEAFLFWYLDERLGASKILFGVSLGIQCFLEVPAFFWANRIIKRIGHANVFLIVVIAYVVRLTGYSFITHAWLSLIFDAGHCITFGLMYSAAVQWGAIIAPPGMAATIQSLIGGVHFGIGRGIGGLVAGVIWTTAGPIVMFRSYAVFTLCVGVIFAIYRFVSIKCAKAHPKEAEANRSVPEKLPVEDEEIVPPAGEEQQMRLM